MSERRGAWSPGSLPPKAPLRAQFYRTPLVSSKTVCQGKLWVQFEALKATVPGALASVNNVFIRGLNRLALRAQGEQKSLNKMRNRQVEDKLKW